MGGFQTGDSDLLQRSLTVSIHPAIKFLTILTEMRKLASSAVLIVMGEKIQFLAAIPNHGAYAILEMKSPSISAPSNCDGYALLFDINIWIQRLTSPILAEPFAFLNIINSQGFTDVICLIGGRGKCVNLGEAKFVEDNGINVDIYPCKVRVVMTTDYFREMISFYKSSNGDAAASVQLVITNAEINWITRVGRLAASTEGCSVQGLMAGTEFRFRMRWSWPVFQVLCSVSSSYGSVVMSVFNDSLEREWYQFSFEKGTQTFSFCYLETNPVEVEFYKKDKLKKKM